MNNYKSKVKTDRFGRPYTWTGLKDKNGSGYLKGYVTLKGVDYQVTVNPAKDPKDEAIEMWATVTKLDKKQQSSI